MDDLIAEVPEEFLQNNIAGDFLTQQGFTFPQLQVTGGCWNINQNKVLLHITG